MRISSRAVRCAAGVPGRSCVSNRLDVRADVDGSDGRVGRLKRVLSMTAALLDGPVDVYRLDRCACTESARRRTQFSRFPEFDAFPTRKQRNAATRSPRSRGKRTQCRRTLTAGTSTGKPDPATRDARRIENRFSSRTDNLTAIDVCGATWPTRRAQGPSRSMERIRRYAAGGAACGVERG